MPARIVVGVTGHRKLADEARLAAAVDTVLEEIVRRAAGEIGLDRGGPRVAAPPLRLVVLSPLAEGADRLVATRVLACGGSELEVVLPMGEADYETDFADEMSKSEFRALLARARTIHRLPHSSNREEAYAAAGRFVVDRSDVLVAIWDGEPGEGPGGTAEIVRYARQARRPIFQIEPDSGAVISRPLVESGKGPA